MKAKLKNKNDKSWFLNNISANLQRDVKVQFGKIDVYHNSHKSEYLLYKDLWASDADRAVRVSEGIANENTRKLMSGDDLGASSGTDQKVKDKVISDLYGEKIEIPVVRMLANQGVCSKSYEL